MEAVITTPLKVVWYAEANGGNCYFTEVDYTTDYSKIREAISRLTLGPGRFVVKDVRVVDTLDQLVWWWKDGKVVN